MGPTIGAEAISECILKKKKVLKTPVVLETPLGNVSVQRSQEAGWKLAITEQIADNLAMLSGLLKTQIELSFAKLSALFQDWFLVSVIVD